MKDLRDLPSVCCQGQRIGQAQHNFTRRGFRTQRFPGGPQIFMIASVPEGKGPHMSRHKGPGVSSDVRNVSGRASHVSIPGKDSHATGL